MVEEANLVLCVLMDPASQTRLFELFGLNWNKNSIITHYIWALHQHADVEPPLIIIWPH